MLFVNVQALMYFAYSCMALHPFHVLPPSCLPGTGEPFRRAAGQRLEEEKAPWRLSRGLLPPQPAVLGLPPLAPVPPAPPQLPPVSVLAVLVVIVLVVVIRVVVLPVVLILQQRGSRCLTYLSTAGSQTDRLFR